MKTKARSSTADVQALAREILAYLASHPAAQDSAEDIASWWQSTRGNSRAADDITAALARLVEAKMVSVQRARDGQLRYRANPKIPPPA
jgi:hypothetical protein